MAKTLGEILTDTRQHIGQTDTTNTSFTDTQLTIWINDAYRRIVIALRHLPITTSDYAVSAQAVTLNSNMVTMDNVKLLNPTSGDYEALTIIGLDALLEMDPNYENADTTIPTHFARTGVFTGTLYPPPSAAVIAQTTPLRAYGMELPTELSSSTDTPDLPGNLHDLISHWPAYRVFSALENQVKATEHITMFNSAIKENKGIATQFSRKLKGWRWGSRS